MHNEASLIATIAMSLAGHPRLRRLLERAGHDRLVDPPAGGAGLSGHAIIVGYGRVGALAACSPSA